MPRWVRALGVGYWLQLKQVSQSSFNVLTALLQPVIFATIAFYMFRSGRSGQPLLYASLGAGLMGIWSTTLFGCGGAIGYQRFQGLLEPMVVSPTPLVLILLPITLATATTGVYSMLGTLLFGVVFFGVPLHLANAGLFLVAVLVTVLSLGLLGIFMASTFILYRNANALSNLLEYPVWLITGLLVPLSLLPGWTHPIAYVLAPTWGVMAVRNAALGGEVLGPVAMCILLGATYCALSVVALGYLERLARQRATLSLT